MIVKIEHQGKRPDQVQASEKGFAIAMLGGVILFIIAVICG